MAKIDRSSESKTVTQYLARHARHSPSIAETVRTHVDHVIVVPIRGEASSFIDGIVPCLVDGQSALVIVVVNGSEGDEGWVHDMNETALAALRERTDELKHRGVGLIVLDHAGPGRRFSADQGVGLARRLGLDLALDLWARGWIRSPWIVSTDADASLPAKLLDDVPTSAAVGAVTFPLWHVGAGDPAVERATAIYELWLRYYALGLAFAGSPYAFQAVGSAVAVHAWAYAAVRGIPTRLAGEDFHLLAKLAKVAGVARSGAGPVLIRARRSHRTPFGTGPAVAAMVNAPGEPEFFAPALFDVLRGWMGALEAAATDSRIDSVASVLDAVPSHAAPAVAGALEVIGCAKTLPRGLNGACSPRLRRQRLHEWFDALKTLRFLRALRLNIPDCPWRDAIDQAPFFAGSPGCDDLDAVRRWAMARELDLPVAGRGCSDAWGQPC